MFNKESKKKKRKGTNGHLSQFIYSNASSLKTVQNQWTESERISEFYMELAGAPHFDRGVIFLIWKTAAFASLWNERNPYVINKRFTFNRSQMQLI